MATTQAWFDNAWTYRAAFVANNPGLTLTNQQVKIDLTSANVHPDYVWSPDGDDIRVLAADDLTPLDYYIENWDQFGETGTILVRIPSLPSGDTTVLVYYDNALATDGSNAVAVLTEVGLRYHTRQSSFDPTSRVEATNEFNSLDDSIVGYGCRTVTSFNSINNNNQFPGGVNSDILFFSNNHFEVPPGETGTWSFRFGGDYGRGGGMYLDNIDSDEKWNDDLWWAFNFGNTSEILQVSGSLSAGFHNLQLIGAEGCCDGGTTVEYQSPANPGVWTLWDTANVNIRSEKCEVVNIPTTVSSSSLVTSTKTSIDLNGGDLEIGDIVRYTVTLNESSGNPAEHVSVTDDIALELGDLNVQSTPAGSADGSVFGGGANGTGLVTVDDITVPANGSVAIIFDVTVATVPVGQTIDNSATIENLSGGADIIVAAATLIVNVNAIPVTGVKSLYLYDNDDLSRVVPLVDQSSSAEIFGLGDSQTYTLIPALQAPLTVDKSIDQTIALYMRRIGGGRRALRIQVAGSVTGVFAEYFLSNLAVPGGGSFSLFPLTLTYTDPNPLTLAAGEAITLEFINETANVNRRIVVYQSNTTGVTPNTILSFPSETVINVDNVLTYDDAFPSGALTTTFSPGDTVYVRAEVSDPFGTVDINAASLDITDAGGTATTGLVMTDVDASGAIKTFEFAYNIVGLPPQGAWNATVTSDEGTEGVISDSGTGSFSVFFPPTLMTLLSSNVPSALPGATVTYTNVTTNTGMGDAIAVVVNGNLPVFTALGVSTFGPGISFDCSAGCPSSGLTMGTPVYSDNDGVSFLYIPTSGGGGAPAGYDSDVTNWQIPMTGTLPGSGTAFTVQFEVIIE